MKKFVFALVLLLSKECFYAQQIDLKWSNEFILDNKLDGFFDDYVGSNSNYVYAKFSDFNRLNKKDKKIKLVAFDKAKMKRVADVGILGYDKSDEVSKLYFEKVIVFENAVYVFWIEEAKGTESLYVQTFDAKLKKVTKLKKVYELPVSDKNKGLNHLIVMGNKVSEKIVIGGELPAEKGQNIKLEYKLMNADFSFAASQQVKLPLIRTSKKKSRGLSSDYELGDDGNIYVKSNVQMDDEEKKMLPKGESSRYPVMTVIDPVKGLHKSINVKFKNKNTFNFSYKIEKDHLKLFGFFCDLDKDPKGKLTHGIFYSIYDQKTQEIKNINFSFFDKAFLDELYAKDKEDQVKVKKRRKDKSPEESINDDYVIESVQSEGQNLILFTSIMKNWSQTVCTSNGKTTTCNTYYYCTKSNVTAFKLSEQGNMIWAKNLDRLITYTGWNVYDVNVIKSDDKFYVIYGSEFQALAAKKNRQSRKSKEQRSDRFEYAVFSNKTGDFTRAEYKVNEVNAKKKDKKSVNATGIQVIDNKFYLSSMNSHFKWGWCFTGILCPVIPYYIYASGSQTKGSGYLGVISPLK